MAKLVLKERLRLSEAVEMYYYFAKDYLSELQIQSTRSPGGVFYLFKMEFPEFNDNPEQWYLESIKDSYPEDVNVRFDGEIILTKYDWVDMVIIPLIEFMTGSNTYERYIAEATKLGFFDNLGEKFVNNWLDDSHITRKDAITILDNMEKYFSEK